MELGSVSVAPALPNRFASFAAGPRLPSFSAKLRRDFSHQLRALRSPPFVRRSCGVRKASQKPRISADDRETATERVITREAETCSPSFSDSETKALLALLLSLGFALGSAEAAMALGPEGPLVEEFWDNMRRYGLYFLTVFTGGLYSLLQPILSLLRNPLTAIFTIAFLTGSFYLLYLVLNTMLGITAYNYDYGS